VLVRPLKVDLFDTVFYCKLSLGVFRMFETLKQWFSTTVLRAACSSQAPFVRLLAVFQ